MGNRNIFVIVAESSAIIRNGLIAVLKRLPNFTIQASEIVSMDALHHAMRSHEVDIVMINPSFCGWFNLDEFKTTYTQSTAKVIAILSHLINPSELQDYDATVSIQDSIENISEIINKLMKLDGEEDGDCEQEALSQREKEIICYVVKGLTNKEIAENLYISVHTVITHRRNISRKLQIHSPAGLTIYAIVNKLVDIKEVKLQ